MHQQGHWDQGHTKVSVEEWYVVVKIQKLVYDIQ